MMQPLQIALLHHRPTRIAATVHDHLDQLVKSSRHIVHPIPILGDLPPRIDLDRFDVIVLHYTLVLASDTYVSAESRARIAQARALKVVFIQDEYRHVNATIDALRAIGAGLLMTCVPEKEIAKVYSPERLPGVRKINVLTGYVDRGLCARYVPPYEQRRIDVGYRARRLPPWLGDLGQEKTRIAAVFEADAAAYGLTCDIGYREEERLYGERWVSFLSNCRATLGVESGASVFDFDGEVERSVRRDLAEWPSVPYDVLRQRHFEHLEGKVLLNQISPRVFEAAALRTLMILYEGEYSGLLKPERHYVPLRKDHSNMADVVAVLRDETKASEIIRRAYEEVALNPANSFGALVARFDNEVMALAQSRLAGMPCYSAQEVADIVLGDRRAARRRFALEFLNSAYRFFYGGLLGWLPAVHRDRVQRVVNPLVLRTLRFLSSIYRTLMATVSTKKS